MAYLATATGQGSWVAANVILFEEVLRLSPTDLGLGRMISAIVAMVFVLPLLTLADRFGTRRSARLAHLLQVAAIAAMYAVTGLWSYVALLTVLTVVRRIADTLRMTLNVELTSSAEAGQSRSALRSLTNIGFALGTGAAAAPLTIRGPAGLAVAVGLYAVLAFCACWALPRADLRNGLSTGSLKADKPARQPAAQGRASVIMRQALADWRFVAALVVATVFSFSDTVLTLSLGLWLTIHHLAPAWVVSPLLLLNTLMVVVLQARLVRHGDTAGVMRRYFVRTAWALSVAMALFAATPALRWPLAALVLVGGTAMLTLGEIFSFGLLWGLPVLFAPEGRLNAYNGLVSTVTTIRDTLGPLVLATFLAGGGPGRWYVGGAVFIATGVVGSLALRRVPHRESPEQLVEQDV
ncbi:MFS transporter [Streptomyces sp. NPDC048521]|uniref:MFS transporter n=1 Tax=Streptomyces sp. NPDC048521 TaxID=3365566 RepID=UPI00371311E5